MNRIKNLEYNLPAVGPASGSIPSILIYTLPLYVPANGDNDGELATASGGMPVVFIVVLVVVSEDGVVVSVDSAGGGYSAFSS